MEDDSVIVKKADGETIILKPDESVEVLDKEGKVKGKEDSRFKVQ